MSLYIYKCHTNSLSHASLEMALSCNIMCTHKVGCIHMHTHTTNTDTHKHTHIHIRTHTHTNTHSHTHTHTHAHTHTQTLTHIHTHTHTHTHTTFTIRGQDSVGWSITDLSNAVTQQYWMCNCNSCHSQAVALYVVGIYHNIQNP